MVCRVVLQDFVVRQILFNVLMSASSKSLRNTDIPMVKQPVLRINGFGMTQRYRR